MADIRKKEMPTMAELKKKDIRWTVNPLEVESDATQENRPSTGPRTSAIQRASKIRGIVKNQKWISTVGVKGFCLILFMALISGFHCYIIYAYRHRMDGSLWPFFLFAIVFALLIFPYSICWRKRLVSWASQKYGNKRKRGMKAKGFSMLTFATWYSDNLALDGKYFLARMYFNEFVETIYQFVNFQGIYVCTLPIGVTSGLCILLLLDSLYRMWTFRAVWFSENHHISVDARNVQVHVDMFVDGCSLVVPPAVMWLAYNMYITRGEMASIVFMPSAFLFVKIRRMYDESLRRYTERQIMEAQSRNSLSLSRRRESMYGVINSAKIAKEQNEVLSTPLRKSIFVVSGISAVFLAVMLASQLLNYSENNARCTEQLGSHFWEKGCKVKVPYCKSLFTPTCDCAVIDTQGYNRTTLPGKFTGLNAMRKLTIQNSALTTMPMDMGAEFKKVNLIVLKNCRLSAFDVDVSMCEELITLYLDFNSLLFVHKSVWNHQVLMNFDISDNPGLTIPKQKILLPKLSYFAMANNSMEIMPTLFENLDGTPSFPSIQRLYISGNKMVTAPSTMKNVAPTLKKIWMAGVGLVSLPDYMSSFERIQFIDVRNNNITIVDDRFMKILPLIAISYFADNPVCSTSLRDKLDCVPLCSKYCFARYHDNGFCDSSCNSFKCDYDGGDCV